MIRFALTIFVSAFLLFQVQPLIARYILPWFGGAPSVWTTCMLFFQMILLAGYAYSHGLTTWLKPKSQAIVHIVLLLSAIIFLPIIPSESLKPEGTESPTWQILILLLMTIGLPYFLLSTTGPLIQAWFRNRFPGRSPYGLFSLSNAGSLLALVTFPVLFEPRLGTAEHAVYWSFGFGIFIVFCGWCAISTLLTSKSDAENKIEVKENFDDIEPAVPGLGDLVMWLLLSLVPSILLLASTNQICQEVAVVPFLWVLPLSLYLISFIICFVDEKPPKSPKDEAENSAIWFFRLMMGYNRTFHGTIMVLGVVLALYCLNVGTSADLLVQIGGFSMALFGCCMTCHGELAKARPHPKYLTLFYLFVSIGGAMGGLFCVLVAQSLFLDYWELHIGLFGAVFLTFFALLRQREWDSIRNISEEVVIWGLVFGVFFFQLAELGEEPQRKYILFGALAFFVIRIAIRLFASGNVVLRRNLTMGTSALFMIAVSAGIAGGLVSQASSGEKDIVVRKRDFYGILKVIEYEHSYTLLNGRINHGFQYKDEQWEMERSSYYAPGSGVGVAITYHPKRITGNTMKIGVIGLGTGTLAAWGEAGDLVRFYEINPEVEEIAQEQFTYIKKSPAEVDIVLGDARVKMQQQLKEDKPQGFDVLVVDAFSSDAIPRHLLTLECIELYRKHLNEDGILAIHISNRFLDLEPICYHLAIATKYESLLFEYGSEDTEWEDGDTDSSWVLLTNNTEFMDNPEVIAREEIWGNQPEIIWTDNFGSIFQVINFDWPEWTPSFVIDFWKEEEEPEVEKVEEEF